MNGGKIDAPIHPPTVKYATIVPFNGNLDSRNPNMEAQVEESPIPRKQKLNQSIDSDDGSRTRIPHAIVVLIKLTASKPSDPMKSATRMATSLKHENVIQKAAEMLAPVCLDSWSGPSCTKAMMKAPIVFSSPIWNSMKRLEMEMTKTLTFGLITFIDCSTFVSLLLIRDGWSLVTLYLMKRSRNKAETNRVKVPIIE